MKLLNHYALEYTSCSNLYLLRVLFIPSAAVQVVISPILFASEDIYNKHQSIYLKTSKRPRSLEKILNRQSAQFPFLNTDFFLLVRC